MIPYETLPPEHKSTKAILGIDDLRTLTADPGRWYLVREYAGKHACLRARDAVRRWRGRGEFGFEFEHRHIAGESWGFFARFIGDEPRA